MTTRTDYPFNAWMLTTAAKPREVTVDRAHRHASGEYVVLQDGRYVTRGRLSESKQACIDAGLADVAKKQAALDKRRATLEKAK